MGRPDGHSPPQGRDGVSGGCWVLGRDRYALTSCCRKKPDLLCELCKPAEAWKAQTCFRIPVGQCWWLGWAQ